MKVRFSQVLLVGSCAFLFSACTANQVDKLRNVGKEPELQKIDPTSGQQPISWPRNEDVRSKASHNSLWKQGSRDFFRDQRARQVGDILTVKISVDDKAALDNKSQAKRDNSDSLSAGSVFGLEKQIFGAIPGKADPSSLLSVSGKADNSGEGTIERGEKVETELAAVVTNIMDNGNLVIYGSQEIRVNFEVRQVTVQGVIRTEDIDADNTIPASRIAEARVSYGGKGLISDVQQPRLGHQVIDILSPF
jgi:flagellar L-ring protein FlgH